ncbi:MAG: pilus assembly protein PilP [Desulfatirhabdiaceae bacterium]
MRKNIFGTHISGIVVILVWCLIVSGCQKQEQPVVSKPVVTRMKIVDAPLQKGKIPPATKEKPEAIKPVMPTEGQIQKSAVAPVDAEVEKARTTLSTGVPSEDALVFQPDAQPMLPDIQKLTYNPEGKIDPFVPLFKDETAVKPDENSERKKRIPQTPLENLDLSQIKLTAIYQTSKGFSALVEESSGKGYVINVGTYIGRNSGKVIAIQREAVHIEEEIEDALGNMRIETRELKLLKPVGEL